MEQRVEIKIRSVPPTFNRAGIKFTNKERVIVVDKATYDILKAEPKLVIGETFPFKDPYADQIEKKPADAPLKKQDTSGVDTVFETLGDVITDVAEIVTEVTEKTEVSENKEEKPANTKPAAKGKS